MKEVIKMSDPSPIPLIDTGLFDEVRQLKREWTKQPSASLTAADVARLRKVLDKAAGDQVVFGPAPNTLPTPVLTPASGRLTVRELQSLLRVKVDGAFGPASREALSRALTNTEAPKITEAQFQAVAEDLGISVSLVKAVRKVEAPRGAFDITGKPTHLYERHVFARNTIPKGRFNASHPSISGPPYGPGGYGSFSSQFGKLTDACFLDPEAAFRACSWGAFQVLGENAVALGYSSALHMALELTRSEAAHLDSFVRFVKTNRLVGFLQQIRPGDPDSAIPFVSRYNGPGFRQFNYHIKLVQEMGR
jgi:hypothetical protein